MSEPRRARYKTPEESFLARTEPIVGKPGCIIWTATMNHKGYGQIRVNGRLEGAHRFAWEREKGPIPEGLHVDHICHNRACVNVEHLRLASPQQNQWNRSGARKGRDLPRGVTRNGRGYSARVKHDGIQHRLGTFDTPEAASLAAATKRNILFGAFAGGN